MSNIILLILCLGIGMTLRASGRLPENAHAVLNTFIIYVSLPALTLMHMRSINLETGLFYAVAMPWLLFAAGAVFFWSIAKVMRFTPQTTGGLMLSSGLGNTSFVGLPMIEAYYGAGGLAVGILIDQLGTYMVLSTAGIVIAALYSSRTVSFGEVVRRIATFPPFIALIAALLLLPFEYPQWLGDVFRRLGDTLVPLALVSVGFQLRLDQINGTKIPLTLGLVFKLLIGPLVLMLLYVKLLGARGDVVQVTLFEAAMGPQIGAAIVAIQHGLNPPLITLLVGVGIVLSFLTLPMWWYLLQGV
jgi:malate permease and related proteins